MFVLYASVPFSILSALQDAGIPWCGPAPVSFILQGQEDRLDSRKRTTEREHRFSSGFVRYLQGDDNEGNHVVQLVEEANELAVQHAEKERARQRRVRSLSSALCVPGGFFTEQ